MPSPILRSERFLWEHIGNSRVVSSKPSSVLGYLVVYFVLSGIEYYAFVRDTPGAQRRLSYQGSINSDGVGTIRILQNPSLPLVAEQVSRMILNLEARPFGAWGKIEFDLGGLALTGEVLETLWDWWMELQTKRFYASFINLSPEGMALFRAADGEPAKILPVVAKI